MNYDYSSSLYFYYCISSCCWFWRRTFGNLYATELCFAFFSVFEAAWRFDDIEGAISKLKLKDY